MASYKLSDLPPHVVAKIRPSDLAELEGRKMLKENPTTTPPKQLDTDTKTKTKRREPNKTEMRYKHEIIDRYWGGGRCIYEGLTFRLANGHKYTPDWVYIDDDGEITVVEVKGSYKFHSHSRARLAFDQARVEWPIIRFIWAVATKEGWKSEG